MARDGAVRRAVRPARDILTEELVGDDGPRVVPAQIQVAQLGEVLPQLVANLSPDALDHHTQPLQPTGSVPGHGGQPLRAEDEQSSQPE
ncbi:MAG TPA: hypothetical protein VE823_02170, partial [Geodermatophilus sp.]|nr:hypothetical protein [Geodermatophilus sp.]